MNTIQSTNLTPNQEMIRGILEKVVDSISNNEDIYYTFGPCINRWRKEGTWPETIGAVYHQITQDCDGEETRVEFLDGFLQETDFNDNEYAFLRMNPERVPIGTLLTDLGLEEKNDDYDHGVFIGGRRYQVLNGKITGLFGPYCEATLLEKSLIEFQELAESQNLNNLADGLGKILEGKTPRVRQTAPIDDPRTHVWNKLDSMARIQFCDLFDTEQAEPRTQSKLRTVRVLCP